MISVPDKYNGIKFNSKHRNNFFITNISLNKIKRTKLQKKSYTKGYDMIYVINNSLILKKRFYFFPRNILKKFL